MYSGQVVCDAIELSGVWVPVLAFMELLRSLKCDDFSPKQSVATSVMPNIFITSTERLLEDHESVVDVVSSWPWDSENKLVLNNRREKYALFRNPQVNRNVIIHIVPGVCFSKVRENSSGPKRQFSNCNQLVLKSCSNLFLMYEKPNDCKVWRLRTSALWSYKGDCGTRNRPEKFRGL